jgi:hypothetical protein
VLVVKRLIASVVLSVLAVLPVASIVCFEWCAAQPDTPMTRPCHETGAAEDAAISADELCALDELSDAESVVTTTFRLQQRSPVAALRLHVTPEGAAAPARAARDDLGGRVCCSLHTILRI